jgi:hypothetical protein
MYHGRNHYCITKGLLTLMHVDNVRSLRAIDRPLISIVRFGSMQVVRAQRKKGVGWDLPIPTANEKGPHGILDRRGGTPIPFVVKEGVRWAFGYGGA